MAGIWTQSCVPTYHEISGLKNVATTEDRVAIELTISASMLAEKPTPTWN